MATDDPQLDPHAGIVADPSDAGLAAALAASLDVAAIFGDLDATIVELQE